MWVSRVLTFSLLVRVDHQSRALVHQQEVLVLIDNVQLGLEDRQKGVLRGGGVKKLVVDVQLKHVPTGPGGCPAWPPCRCTLTRLMRMYFWARGAGRRGRVLASQRSSRWPASLGPMVNSRMGAQPFSDEFPLDAGGEGVYPTLLAAVQRRQAGIPVPIIP